MMAVYGTKVDIRLGHTSSIVVLSRWLGIICVAVIMVTRERTGFCWSNPITPSTGTNRLRNSSMAGGYPQQGYQARPPTNWGAPGAPPMQQPGYGYVQPSGYPGSTPQYSMSQPPYAGYPPQQTSGGYPSSWDPTPGQQNAQSGGYDYYNQQSSSQQQTPGGSTAPADNTGYNYNQPPASGYNQQGQGYTQDGYGGYQAPQSGYGQPGSYDQQQGYGSAGSYGNVNNSTQEEHTPSYSAQGDSTQPSGYGTGQQPSPNPTSYPAQGAATQPGYGVPPTSQGGYGNQAPAQSAYPGYGPPQGQKPGAYGQTQQSPTATAGYGQPGYPHSQPPPSGYTQPDSGSQRAPPTGFSATQPGYGAPSYGAPPSAQPGYGGAYSQPPASGYAQPDSAAQRAPPSSSAGSAAAQPGYGAAAYGAPPGQPGYGQAPQSYNSYGYSQPAYPTDGNTTPASQTVQQTGGVSKSPPS